MEPSSTQLTLLKDIVDRISVGVFVVNKQNELVLWNGYMENYSQTKADQVVGKNIFEAFPDLPKNWLEQKIHNVFVIKNFSFTSWEHRPYLFKFLHNRPITGGIDYMRQNCTFLPMKGDTGEIEYVCITLFDVTDTSIYESMLKSAVRSLAEASNRDGLTNVYNRRFLETTMSKEFSRLKRYGGTLSFIIIDLDHFKAVNDTYGHLAGDEILKVASKRIAEGLRTADTLSRYGGEEFAVMLPETPIDGAAILAQRLCDNLAVSPVDFGENSITVSASLGVAEFDPNMDSHEEIISFADEMLYKSKENGRNQVTVYYPKSHNADTEHTLNNYKLEIEKAEKAEINAAKGSPEEIIPTTASTDTEPATVVESEQSALIRDDASTPSETEIKQQAQNEQSESAPTSDSTNVDAATSAQPEMTEVTAVETIEPESTSTPVSTQNEEQTEPEEAASIPTDTEVDTTTNIEQSTDETDLGIDTAEPETNPAPEINVAPSTHQAAHTSPENDLANETIEAENTISDTTEQMSDKESTNVALEDEPETTPASETNITSSIVTKIEAKAEAEPEVDLANEVTDVDTTTTDQQPKDEPQEKAVYVTIGSK